MKLNRLLFLSAFCVRLFAADADEWPQFLGPSRNGVYSGSSLSTNWEKTPPKVLWKQKLGEGFAGPVCAMKKVLIFQRIEDQEVLSCLDERSGKSIWECKHPTHYRDDFGFDEGPRATPAIQADRVYTLGAEGMIECVDFRDGHSVWKLDSRKEFGAGKGYFGMACSPLIEGENVLLNIGGENGAGIIALDRKNGKLKWKATASAASYSSPVNASLDGKAYSLFFTRSGLVIIDPTTGAVKVDFPWRSKMDASVNAATPIVVDDHIFLSASYGTGAILLKWNKGTLEKVWSADEVLSNHYASSVYKDGYLYGFDGRQEFGPSFVCVEFKTGKLQWRKENFGAGTVTLAGDKLLVLKESGELQLCAANSKNFELLGQTQILGSTVRAYPAIANKTLFARDKSQLVAVQLP